MARFQSAHFGLLANAVVFLTAGLLLTACDQAQQPAAPVQQAPTPSTERGTTQAGEYADYGPEDFASAERASLKSIGFNKLEHK